MWGVIEFESDQQAIVRWIKLADSSLAYEIRAIQSWEMRDWRFADEQLRHRSERFFSIGAFEYTDSSTTFSQPLIIQPEIGTIGFLLRPAQEGWEVLLQAKYEPGNAQGVQIAPTIQATRSNLDGVHQGARVPFAAWFADPMAPAQFDVLQTEEAGRFLRKRNRNVTKCMDSAEHGNLYRWCRLKTVKKLLGMSHLVNTDARSCLCCFDWTAFFRSRHDSIPFDGDDTLARQLQRSLETAPEKAELRARLDEFRAEFGSVKEVPLDALSGWQVDDTGFHPSEEGSFSVRYYAVRAESREVGCWSQPFVVSQGVGLSVLALSQRSGLLKIFLRLRRDIGVWNGAEVAPSYFREPGEVWSPRGESERRLFEAIVSGRVLLEADNTEEGSRFYKDVISFRVVLIDAPEVQNGSGGMWVTLGTAKDLFDEGLLASNELRSALSFLIPLL
jgi:oxidase EvaA